MFAACPSRARRWRNSRWLARSRGYKQPDAQVDSGRGGDHCSPGSFARQGLASVIHLSRE